MRRRPGRRRGYHQYDGQLENFSRKNIDAEIAALKDFEKRIEAIHPDADARILFREATADGACKYSLRNC
jgi:hypothetical protein